MGTAAEMSIIDEIIGIGQHDAQPEAQAPPAASVTESQAPPEEPENVTIAKTQLDQMLDRMEELTLLVSTQQAQPVAQQRPVYDLKLQEVPVELAEELSLSREGVDKLQALRRADAEYLLDTIGKTLPDYINQRVADIVVRLDLAKDLTAEFEGFESRQATVGAAIDRAIRKLPEGNRRELLDEAKRELSIISNKAATTPRSSAQPKITSNGARPPATTPKPPARERGLDLIAKSHENDLMKLFH